MHGGLATALSGRYEIERELGHGGMAVVYLARDLKHDRLVAIKVLPPELATSLGAERFLREISIAARLTHPNILTLHDSVAEGGMLGYVMPFVDGDSVAQRIRREGPLPIEEAIGIARQVASALEYAHKHGVVHRDIKPDNILLVGDQALVADFGLARAIHSASNSPLTQTGIAVGTPAYMSPEQAAGDREVDGRSDIYSLACVLFEMIAGAPPFRASSAQSVLAQHATRKPPSLCEERASCPEALDAAVRRAMAKSPADRFRNAGEFGRAIGHAFYPQVARRVVPWRWLGAAAGLAAASLVGYFAQRHLAADSPLDATRYVVLPFTAHDSASARALVTGHVTDALGEWQGLDVVDRRMATEAAEDVGGVTRTAKALALARRLRASRAVLGDVSAAGDSLIVRATLYDAQKERELKSYVVTVPADQPGTQKYRELANALVREGTELPWTREADRGPASLAAWRAYDDGRSAIERWQLGVAEGHLKRALAADGDHALAQLWLAQVGAWLYPDQPAQWSDAAIRAAGLVSRMSPHDSLIAEGVRALAQGRFPDACVAYRRLRELAPDDPVGWFGIGQCQGMDPIVVRDPRSPSGWRFRGSYHAAAAAYDSAIHRATGTPAFAFRRMERFLFTQPSRVRSGRADPPDALTFAAYPALDADTLTLVPWPSADVAAGAVKFDRSTRAAALRLNTMQLAEQFMEWTRRDSTSADVRELLARVQEVAGERSADGLRAARTVAEARRLSTDSAQQLSLATTQVRLLVKDGAFAAARVLADSLLASHPRPTPAQAEMLAGIAALIGRAETTAHLLAASPPDDGDARLPDQIADSAASYMALAALGACDAHFRGFQETIERLLLSYVPLDGRAAAARAVFTRAQSLAVPCLGASVMRAAGKTPDPLVRMQQALADGRPPAVRAEFDALQQLRRAIRPGDVSLDHTLQESWLLEAIGDTAAAIRHLDLPLSALATLGDRLVFEVPQAAAIGRAMAMRAELAATHGDVETARFWARNVVALWSTASPVLQPVVARMRTLAGAPRTAR